VSEDARIVVISGLPGAGKSTAARLLALRLSRSAHVEADHLQRLVVSCSAWPDQVQRIQVAILAR
jgi:adenylate kinase family enzyme